MAADIENRLSTTELELAALKLRISKIEKDSVRKLSTETLSQESLLNQLAGTVTGVTGLQEIVDSKTRKFRLLWAFLFCFGVIATIFFTYRTAEEYLGDPSATKVKLQVAGTYSFPAMLICPQAWVDVEKASALNITLDGLKYSLGYFIQSPAAAPENITKARLDFLSFYHSHKFPTLVHYYKAISVDLPTVYSEDQFQSLSNAILVDNEEITLIKDVFRSGMCYAYEVKPFDVTWDATRKITAKQQDRSMGLLGETSGWWLQLGVDLHLLSDVATSLLLAPNTTSFVLVHVQSFSTFDQPDTPCRTAEKYSVASCMANCQNEVYNRRLNCQMFWLTSFQQKYKLNELCHFMEPPLRNTSKLQLTTGERDMCLTRCPQECKRVLYQLSMPWHQPMSKRDLLLVANTTTDSFVELHLEHYSVYQGGIFTIQEVSTYSFTTLINNIGGTLGLFVGATLMTVAQLARFLIRFLVQKRRASKKANITVIGDAKV